MKMIISGKNIDVTPGLRSAVEAKLGKLERYFTADTEIYVTLSVEKDRQKIEVTIPMKGNIIRSEQTSSGNYRETAQKIQDEADRTAAGGCKFPA